MQEAGHDLADELQARGLTLHAPCRDPGLVWAMAVFTAAGRGMLGARGLVGDDAYRQLIEDDTGKLGLLCGERFLRWRRIGEDRVGTTRYATIEDLVGSSMALLRVLREPSVGADGGATREELPAEAREEDASEPTTLAKIESMRDTDAGKLLLYTVGELGDRLGVDKSTISRALSVSGDAGDARRKYAMYRRERKRITDRMRKGRAISEADEKMLTRLGHLEGVAKWTCARCRAV